MSKFESRTRAARVVAAYLEETGQPKMAEDVRKILRSNNTYHETLSRLHGDNMKLRAKLEGKAGR